MGGTSPAMKNIGFWGKETQSVARRLPRVNYAAAFNRPSAFIASCTAGRAATRFMNAVMFGNADRSMLWNLVQFVSVGNGEIAHQVLSSGQRFFKEWELLGRETLLHGLPILVRHRFVEEL